MLCYRTQVHTGLSDMGYHVLPKAIQRNIQWTQAWTDLHSGPLHYDTAQTSVVGKHVKGLRSHTLQTEFSPSYIHSSIYHGPIMEGNWKLCHQQFLVDSDPVIAAAHDDSQHKPKTNSTAVLTWPQTTVHNAGVKYVGVWCIVHGIWQLWCPPCFINYSIE